MRFAFADPPYLGCGKKHYGKLHADAALYDTIDGHRALVHRLVAEFPDGWALSLSSSSLKAILALCPDDVRIAAWVKPFASWKMNPAYTWEPVIFRGGRKMKQARGVPTVRDYVSASITLRRTVKGAKPDAFCFWIFDFLGMQPDDDFVDLFPGSGAVSRAHGQWRNQLRLSA